LINRSEIFVFCLQEQDVVPFIDKIIDWISIDLPEGANSGKIIFQSRLILSELITNAIKHARVPEVYFEIHITAEALLIVKKEKGNRFQLINDQFNTVIVNHKGKRVKKVELAKDLRHGLFALFQNDSSIEFTVETYEENAEKLTGALEHYGLIIITLSSHEFKYEYDQSSFTNSFSAKINF
jgi:hypothetical protein